MDGTFIFEFTGEYWFLSNFFPAEVVGEDGFRYPTVEHAYQAAKSGDPGERERIRNAPTPGDAKRLGRVVTLDRGWEIRKERVMRALLSRKFAPGSELSRRLLGTDGALLLEGNTWGDRYWGVCDGAGLNRLGVLLMEIREELRQATNRRIGFADVP